MTKPLSPAARAVYDAVLEICPAPADVIAAAALRVAANQVLNRFIRDRFLAIAAELEGAE
jgi:hypothetical protein